MSFADLGLPGNILSVIEKIGYKAPTPIQEKAIPVALSGKDIIGAAQTGTGKTAAYALPTLARIGEARGKPRCLVLVPTRELAMQVDEAVLRRRLPVLAGAAPAAAGAGAFARATAL